MLTNAVCIAAWLPFLIPKRGTHGENGQTSQYRWTPRRPPSHHFSHRQNKGNAYRIWFPNNLNCSNKLKQAANFKIAPVRPSHSYTSQNICNMLWLQDNDQLSISPKWKVYTEKIWAIGDRFQDVPGVDCRQKCHNSHDIWGLLGKNIIAPAPSSYPSKTTPKHFPCKWIVNTASFGRGQRNRIWCICRPFAAYLPHFLFIVWNYDNCVFMHKTRPSQESNWALAAHFRSVFFSNLSLALLGRHTCSADAPVPINMPKRR